MVNFGEAKRLPVEESVFFRGSKNLFFENNLKDRMQ